MESYVVLLPRTEPSTEPWDSRYGEIFKQVHQLVAGDPVVLLFEEKRSGLIASTIEAIEALFFLTQQSVIADRGNIKLFGLIRRDWYNAFQPHALKCNEHPLNMARSAAKTLACLKRGESVPEEEKYRTLAFLYEAKKAFLEPISVPG